MEFVTLNNGVKMPILGYGTYQIEPEITQKCVEEAISVGYRSIDTAAAYFNESGVGAAVNSAIKGGIKREELFITTKLWITHASEKDALKAFESSMQKLGLDYLDLYLIHQPFGDVYGAWRAMSGLLKEGRIKAIGVSNFYPDRIMDFCLNNEITPSINQVECHPFFAKFDEQENMRELGVAMQSWASFAEGKNGFFTNEILAKIGAKYNKSIAQVTLRWLIQRGIVVIPKSINIDRMKENFNVFDFKLDAKDMESIAALDTGDTLFMRHDSVDRVKFLSEIHRGKM